MTWTSFVAGSSCLRTYRWKRTWKPYFHHTDMDADQSHMQQNRRATACTFVVSRYQMQSNSPRHSVWTLSKASYASMSSSSSICAGMSDSILGGHRLNSIMGLLESLR